MHEGCGRDNTLHRSAADRPFRDILGALGGAIAQRRTDSLAARADPGPNGYAVRETGLHQRPGTSA